MAFQLGLTGWGGRKVTSWSQVRSWICEGEDGSHAGPPFYLLFRKVILILKEQKFQRNTLQPRMVSEINEKVITLKLHKISAGRIKYSTLHEPTGRVKN